MRLVPIGLTAAAAVAGGAIFLAATGASAGATHDDADALSQIASAQAALSAAADDLTAPPPTVTVTATTTETAPPETTTATVTVTSTVTAAAAVPEPRVASVYQNAGETWADACLRTMTYGFTGCVRYLPAGTAISWDTQLQALAAKHPAAIDLQLTAKTYSDAGLKAVADNLPTAWRSGFKFNYYQEPEDNLTTAAQQQAYRDTYTAAAKVLIAAGLSKPWLEWHEYAGVWNEANFTPPAGDFAGVLFSLFEYNEKDTLATQVPHIQSMMSTYAPGKPWALMAGAYTLEPGSGPFTSAQLNAQAAWLTKMHDMTKAAGSVGWGWYNSLQAGTGGAAGESRVELNPAALSALKSFGG